MHRDLRRRDAQIGRGVPAGEELRDGKSQLIEDAYAERATADAIDEGRGGGRPPLFGTGESPLLLVCVSRDLDEAIRHAAERSGKSRADWVRDALDEAE